jgi:hypothetical protein
MLDSYTIGDNTHKDISRYPWRMDDEKVAYKGYEKMVAAGRSTWRSVGASCMRRGGVAKRMMQFDLIVRPSALAVLRLMTNSTLEGMPP